MALVIDVRNNMSRVMADMSRVTKEVMERATVSALNKTVAQAKTAAAREIRSAGYGLSPSTIKKALIIKKAYPGKLTASIVASGKPIPLVQYAARATAKGVSVNVLHGRKVVAHAFIATMPSGHKGVFVRQAGGKHKPVNKDGRKRWSALPIRELFGPAIPDALSNATVQQTLQAFIDEKFPQLFEHEIKWLMR